jgi:hypothetical protein
MFFEITDILISVGIFAGMGQGKETGKLLFRKIFTDGVSVTEDQTSITFSSTGGGGSIAVDKVAIGTGNGITDSFIEVSTTYNSLQYVNSVRGSYDLSRASLNSGYCSIVIGGSKNKIALTKFSTIVGGQTNSIDGFFKGNDLILGGSLNVVYSNRESSNKIFSGHVNKITSDNCLAEIFGGCENIIQGSLNDTNKYNIILGGNKNKIQYSNSYSLIVGGKENTIESVIDVPSKFYLDSNTILSSYQSSIYSAFSSYFLPDFPSPDIPELKTATHNNILSSDKSTISGLFSTYGTNPRYNNIIGSSKSKSGSKFSTILSGRDNRIIGYQDKLGFIMYKYNQIISSDESNIYAQFYGNIISSCNAAFKGSSSRAYTRNIVSSGPVYSIGDPAGGTIISSVGICGIRSTILSSCSVKSSTNDQKLIISSSIVDPSIAETKDVNTDIIISSNLNQLGSNFGSSQLSGLNDIYPQNHSMILSSSLVQNYNPYTVNIFYNSIDSTETMIISSNRILSGYNCSGFCPTFGMTLSQLNFSGPGQEIRCAIDKTLVISSIDSRQRTNVHSSIMASCCSYMSNGRYDSIIGGCCNQIKSFGPGFYNNNDFISARGCSFTRLISGGETGEDLGLSKQNMILGGSKNRFLSRNGNLLQIGTAGPGFLLDNHSLNTMWSSIIGGCCNTIIADVATASSSTCAICNPVSNSVILGGCGLSMIGLSNRTGVDNLIISGTAFGDSDAIASCGISGTFNSPITQICVCRGFVTCVVTSDIRLKIIIKKSGKSYSGINIYLFKYISDPFTTYQGVIAQELLNTKYESAVSTGRNGFYQVDYSKIDVEFKEVDYAKKDFQYSSI